MVSKKRHLIPEAELVATAQAEANLDSGRDAASELLGRYTTHVYRWCRRYQPDSDLARDMAQEVLMNAYRKLGSFSGRSRFSSWLFMLTRNRCLDELRRLSLPVVEWDERLGLADPTANAAAAAERQDADRALLRRLAKRLTAEEQEAIWLRYVEGVNVDEITVVLGLAGATGARGLLQGARRKLRANWPKDEDYWRR